MLFQFISKLGNWDQTVLHIHHTSNQTLWLINLQEITKSPNIRPAWPSLNGKEIQSAQIKRQLGHTTRRFPQIILGGGIVQQLEKSNNYIS